MTVGDRSYEFSFDEDLSGGWASLENKTERVTHEAVQLQPGERIEIVATEHKGEFARIDAIEFIPVDGPTQPKIPDGDGLLGTYYEGRKYQTEIFKRTDGQIDFSWGKGAPLVTTGPDMLMTSDTFSVRWNGYITPEFSEDYTFATTTDDGVRLWIDDQLIIDNWTRQAEPDNQASITLEAGKFYELRMDYFEAYGSASAQLGWSSNSQALEIVSTENLYTSLPEGAIASA